MSAAAFSSIVQVAAGAAPSGNVVDTLLESFKDFANGVVTLDPEQAAIRGGLTLLVLIGAVLAVLMVRLLFKALLSRLAPASDADQAQPRKRDRIGKWTMFVARIAVWIAALLLVLNVWGFEFGQLTEGALGAALAIAGRIALILVLVLAAIEATEFAIAQVFHRIEQRADRPRRAAQLRTLSPLLIAVARTVLVVVAAMMLLSEVGVEVGPLLAGAGIVGLAVGFGAQTLVKDFLTGAFLVLEDTVSIGDFVRVGDTSGTVEQMTLRTIKLRGFDGTLHVYPYSEAQVLHNMTKDFSYYVFDLSVSYSTDIAKALELMAKTGEELRTDPAFRKEVLAPLEVFGVNELGDSAVVLRARVKTEAGMQWAVGREYLKRIKLAFDAAGVEIPFPHLKLVAPDEAIAMVGGKPDGG